MISGGTKAIVHEDQHANRSQPYEAARTVWVVLDGGIITS